MDKRFLNQLLATTIVCGAATSIAAPAQAQILTGTRLATDTGSTSPVLVVTSQEIELQGTTRVEDLLNTLPQVTANQGIHINNGASGTANVDLRGLGSSRTLVLVNGRRLQPGNPYLQSGDLNFIPAALVDRVDVLTGGASSVYGADAVSGVVNFILNTDFEGIRLNGHYGLFQHNNNASDLITQEIDGRGFERPEATATDGGTADLNLMVGTGFAGGRGHIMAFAGYRKTEPVRFSDRDFASCDLLPQSSADPAHPYSCRNPADNIFFTYHNTFTIGPNRTFIPGTVPFNPAPYNFFQRPDERYTLGAFANYEISNAFKPYLEAMFMQDRTASELSPSANFFNTTTINCDNPLLSAQQRSIVCAPGNLVDVDGEVGGTPQVFFDTHGNPYFRGHLLPLRRNLEGGNRRDELDHESYRIVAGMRGDLSTVWSYDAYYQFAQTDFASTYLNDFSVTRLERALDVVDGPAPGVDPICRSRDDGTDPNCVPWDIFARGSATPDAIDYLTDPAFQESRSRQQVFHANLTGNLGAYGIKFPWADDGVGFNFGGEYRKESLDLQTDAALSSNDLAGQPAPVLPVNGEYDVAELFAEVRIPLISDRPFFEQLEFRAGYRYSKYDVANNSFSTDTYKFEGEWSPVRDIRFRGSYNRAVRAPNITELFEPQRVVLDFYTDPCAGPESGGRVNGLTEEQCARTGVTPAQFGHIAENPADRYHTLIGGNPDLEPEVADTWTVGAVIQPRFLPRFALTVDFFDIEIRDTISLLGSNQIFDQCIETGELCDQIQRNAQGSLWTTQDGFVRGTETNAGAISARGVDFTASYSHDIGSLGSLGFSFVGTWLDELSIDPVGPVDYDCAGFFGNSCGLPAHEWRAKTRVTLTLPQGLGLSAQWRYFSSVESDRLSSDPDLSGTVNPAQERIGSVNYLDLVLTARIGDHYSFRLGANNILDRDPPIVPQAAPPFGSGNTYPQVYDALGRYIFAGVTLDF